MEQKGSLQQTLVCKRCALPYDMSSKRPTVLSCGHSLCCECFYELKSMTTTQTVPCPHTGAGEHQAVAPPTPIFNKSLLEIMQSTLQSQPKYHCEDHEHQQVAFFCQRCSALKCSSCLHQHNDHAGYVKNVSIAEIQEHARELQKYVLEMKDDITQVAEFLEKVEEEQYPMNGELVLKGFTMGEGLVSHLFKDFPGQFKSFTEKHFGAQQQPPPPQYSQPPPQQYSQPPGQQPPQDLQQQIGQAPPGGFCQDSYLLTEQSQKDQLIEWLGRGANVFTQLIYRGTADGFSSQAFHEKVDNKGATLSIVYSNQNYICGGFASSPWNSTGQVIPDPNAFLFQLVPYGTKHPVKADKASQALMGNKQFLLGFGITGDFILQNNCNAENSCQSNLGQTFEGAYTYPPGSNEAKIFMAGAGSFHAQEIEVFLVK